MQFCSEYGYNYGFNGSDSEDISDEEEQTKKKVIKKVRKADSNIIAVKFDQLVMTNEMIAGDPIKCRKCESIVSMFSKANINDKKVWTCEFCYEENDLSSLLTTLDEIPKQADATFLLEPAPVVQQDNTKAAEAASATVKSTDNNYLSFCIDISGSMDTFIPEKETSKGDKKDEPVSVEQIQLSKNMTRLQGVKIACVENIKNLKDEEPNKRVNLITFSSTVKYFGDGSKVRGVNGKLMEIGGGYGGGYGYGGYAFQQQQQQQFGPTSNSRGLLGTIKSATKSLFSSSKPTGKRNDSDYEEETAQDDASNQNVAPENAPDILVNREKLMTLAQNQDGNLKGINETHHNLEMLIKNLKTEGSTALGPGLVFAIGFAAKKPGSQILLCTDGAANIGMGSMGHGDESEKFYEDLADEAKSKGVTVNVVSMEGTDCKLALLGKITDRTNGALNIVNPLNLTSQFKSILDNRIVATNVQAKLIVNNKYLYIRDESLETEEGKAIETNNAQAKERIEKLKKSIIVKDIGNANIDTEITFEYGIRKLKEKADVKDLSELPFQLQITYTTYDGAKALRVYTQKQKFTTERDKAEKNLLSQNLIYINAVQQMSHQVMSNNVVVAKYREKQITNMNQRNLWLAPQAYSTNSIVVRSITKSTRAEDLNDEMAEEMYRGKKMNITNINNINTNINTNQQQQLNQQQPNQIQFNQQQLYQQRLYQQQRINQQRPNQQQQLNQQQQPEPRQQLNQQRFNQQQINQQQIDQQQCNQQQQLNHDQQQRLNQRQQQLNQQQTTTINHQLNQQPTTAYNNGTQLNQQPDPKPPMNAKQPSITTIEERQGQKRQKLQQ